MDGVTFLDSLRACAPSLWALTSLKLYYEHQSLDMTDGEECGRTLRRHSEGLSKRYRGLCEQFCD